MILKDVLKTIITPEEVIKIDSTFLYTKNNAPFDSVLVVLWFKNKTIWQGLYTDVTGYLDDQEILLKFIEENNKMEKKIEVAVNSETQLIDEEEFKEYAENPKFKLKEKEDGTFVLLEKMNG
jgi:hypothetical protein